MSETYSGTFHEGYSSDVCVEFKPLPGTLQRVGAWVWWCDAEVLVNGRPAGTQRLEVWRQKPDRRVARRIARKTHGQIVYGRKAR